LSALALPFTFDIFIVVVVVELDVLKPLHATGRSG
jgi:hypothetical protein